MVQGLGLGCFETGQGCTAGFGLSPLGSQSLQFPKLLSVSHSTINGQTQNEKFVRTIFFAEVVGCTPLGRLGGLVSI